MRHVTLGIVVAFLVAAVLSAPVWGQSQQSPGSGRGSMDDPLDPPNGHGGQHRYEAPGKLQPSPETEKALRQQAEERQACDQATTVTTTHETFEYLGIETPVPIVQKVVVQGEIRYIVKNRRGLSDPQILAYINRSKFGTGAHRFSNSETPPGYAQGAVQNHLHGYPDGTKRPNWPMTRAEGATLAQRGQAYTDQQVARERSDRQTAVNALWAAINGLPTWWGLLLWTLGTLALLGLLYLLWHWLTGRHDHWAVRTVGAPHNGLLNAPFGGRMGGATSPTGRMII